MTQAIWCLCSSCCTVHCDARISAELAALQGGAQRRRQASRTAFVREDEDDEFGSRLTEARSPGTTAEGQKDRNSPSCRLCPLCLFSTKIDHNDQACIESCMTTPRPKPAMQGIAVCDHLDYPIHALRIGDQDCKHVTYACYSGEHHCLWSES